MRAWVIGIERVREGMDVDNFSRSHTVAREAIPHTTAGAGDVAKCPQSLVHVPTPSATL